MRCHVDSATPLVMPQGSGHSVPMTFEELLAHHAAITAQAEHDRQALQIALLTIDKLKTEIAYLKRMRYGRSSERLEHDTQMLLMDEAHAPSSPVQPHVDESLGNVVELQREWRKRQAKDPPWPLRAIYLPTCHGAPSCTQRSHARAGAATAIAVKSAPMSASNSTTSPAASTYCATCARSWLAAAGASHRRARRRGRSRAACLGQACSLVRP